MATCTDFSIVARKEKKKKMKISCDLISAYGSRRVRKSPRILKWNLCLEIETTD